MDLVFTLAGAPRGKERVKHTFGPTGHAYTPEKTVTFESRLAYAAQEAMNGRPLFDGPLHLVLCAYMPIPTSKPNRWKAEAASGLIRPTIKPDFDNIAKCVDALNLVVWVDDKQIVSAVIEKHYSEAPRTVVKVRKVNPLMKGAFG